LVPWDLDEVEKVMSQPSQNQLEKKLDLENFRKFIMSQRNLSGLQKKIMIGIIFEGKDEKELAGELNYSVGHINVNKHRALEKLKQRQSFFDFLKSWAS
jgi:DNA-directed RNA polymerase specialized sigma24 family protein